ncbi:partitioning defective 3 homolog B-like [Hypomesus transpacificus]|uniref:partitioning defective 3 homolog B-like n=1 Tax=Hypomesus transpacificus TaxID=137520 RepID=UPI001F07D5E9|nr:partitioning defective 3 homolog B-like [Hypomesus transpacificus]
MKVTVTFGGIAVVVPCKDGWTVRDLILQATLRYRKVLDQEGEFAVRTYQLKYSDGGILDQDDLLSDLVEDRDKPCQGVRRVNWTKERWEEKKRNSLPGAITAPAPTPVPVVLRPSPASGPDPVAPVM